jgi:uncharacterized protein YdeI (YjbR/CyaY-like superfamily)
LGLDDLEVLRPRDAAELRAWLEEHHETSGPEWLAVAKKGSRLPGVTYDEAVEEALSFGWIDSTARRLDEDAFRILFARRKRGSTWAASNKARVERLVAEGRMRPAGMAAVEAAKADGSWEGLSEVDALIVPPDLAEALDADAEARANFDAFPDSVKRMVLYRVASVKKPETRARRIAEAVADAKANRKRLSP